MTPSGQIKRLVLGAVFFVLCAACANTQRVDPLDLSEPNRELERTSENVENYVFQLEASLEKLSEHSTQLVKLDRRRLRPPFPTDAFKHALISCLNVTNMQLEKGQPELVQIAKRFEITCPVQAIAALDRTLDPGTEDAKFAIGALRDLDQFRVQRNIFQKLLRNLPDQLSRTTAFIGSRKTDLRKLRDSIRRRRAEFRPADFTDAMKRLDNYEQRLLLLEKRTNEVRDRTDEWTDAFGSQIDALYKMIAELDIEQLRVEESSNASNVP